MIAEYENRILTLIDNNVEQANDDELFAGGYLCGHITLAAAQAEALGSPDLASYAELIEDSVNKAIKAGELSPPDQALVFGLWNKLLQQIQ